MPDEIFPVPSAAVQEAHIDTARYEELYRRSLEDLDGFWAEQAQILDWIKPYGAISGAADQPLSGLFWSGWLP